MNHTTVETGIPVFIPTAVALIRNALIAVGIPVVTDRATLIVAHAGLTVGVPVFVVRALPLPNVTAFLEIPVVSITLRAGPRIPNAAIRIDIPTVVQWASRRSVRNAARKKWIKVISIGAADARRRCTVLHTVSSIGFVIGSHRTLIELRLNTKVQTTVEVIS